MSFTWKYLKLLREDACATSCLCLWNHLHVHKPRGLTGAEGGCLTAAVSAGVLQLALQTTAGESSPKAGC